MAVFIFFFRISLSGRLSWLNYIVPDTIVFQRTTRDTLKSINIFVYTIVLCVMWSLFVLIKNWHFVKILSAGFFTENNRIFTS